MKLGSIAMIVGGVLLAGCESSPVYVTQTEFVGSVVASGVNLVLTREYLSTSGLVGEDWDAGVQYSADATNNNPHKVCALMRFTAPSIGERATTLVHNQGYFLDPGRTMSIGYLRFPDDRAPGYWELVASRKWVMDSQNQYCVPTN